MYPEDENVDYNGALVTELLAQTLCGLSVNQLTKQPMVSALVSRTSKNPVARLWGSTPRNNINLNVK